MIVELMGIRGGVRPALFCVLATLACASQAEVQPSASQPAATAESTVVPGGKSRHYRISAEDSLIKIFVRRAGALSRFGHNHIIGGPVVSGRIRVADNLADADFELAVSVSDFEVDRPEWRAQAGDAYSSSPDEKDIAGTRENMLSEKVLAVDKFPIIRIESTQVRGDMPEFSVVANINIREQTQPIQVPVLLTLKGDSLIAEGEFRLQQSEFGLKPFSILLGTIKVGDELKISYRIVAVREL